MSMWTRLYDAATLLGAAATLSLVGLGTYWLYFDDTNPLEVAIATVINPNDIHPGGHFLVHTKACVTRPAEPGSAVRTVRNSYVYILNDTSVINAAVGCFDTTKRYGLPLTAIMGPHTFQSCATYRINPLVDHVGCSPLVPFNVTEGPADSN